MGMGIIMTAYSDVRSCRDYIAKNYPGQPFALLVVPDVDVPVAEKMYDAFVARCAQTNDDNVVGQYVAELIKALREVVPNAGAHMMHCEENKYTVWPEGV